MKTKWTLCWHKDLGPNRGEAGDSLESYDSKEEAIGRLREEWRKKNQIGDTRKRRFVDWHKGSFYEVIEEWDGVEWKEKTSETVCETDECA